jgi:hypothetical protein
MKVIKTGNVYKATRITGPQHNFLGLVLSETDVSSIIIERLCIDISKAEVETLAEQQLIDAVQRGVTEANEAFGTHFCVERLQYVPTATPHPAAYQALAKQIIERATMDARLKEHTRG